LNFGELLTSGVLFFALSFAGAVLLLIAQHLFHDGGSQAPLKIFALCGLNGGAALATWLLGGRAWSVLVPLLLGSVAVYASSRPLRNFTVAGRSLLVAHLGLTAFAVVWGAFFIATIPVSTITRALMFAGYPLLVVALPVGSVQVWEQWEVLCRKNWLRPRSPLPVTPRERYPKVSLHVPAYSEPPDVVMATLDALARLKYPNFEVLVIDNNTEDPDLWRPVEAHCRSLGERFRFYHLDRWPGAKAGALNFALQRTAPDAELVGVIDADYHAEPDFLASLVGYFDDPRMGFVQTPHDYRGWEGSTYLRMCYWEYRYFFKTMLVSRNERGAALTVGTMCLIRRAALEEAGGWAEWCVTEDSELAIRIHALGYGSVYTTASFGRGLIPETFSGYKRQRFRWTYGPVQELKRHYRLSLPSAWGKPSRLSVAQKVHHLNHGLDRLNVGLGFLLIPLGGAIVASMVAHQEVVPVPQALWVVATVGLLSGFALRWLVYRAVIGCSLGDTLGALLASSALSYTVSVASLWGFFTENIPWRRTNKFRALPMGLAALRSARTELLLGGGVVLFAAGAFALLPRSGLVLMLLGGGVLQALPCFAAGALSLLAERDVQSRRGSAAGGQSVQSVERLESTRVSGS
jgi:hypothetical protein